MPPTAKRLRQPTYHSANSELHYLCFFQVACQGGKRAEEIWSLHLMCNIQMLLYPKSSMLRTLLFKLGGKMSSVRSQNGQAGMNPKPSGRSDRVFLDLQRVRGLETNTHLIWD